MTPTEKQKRFTHAAIAYLLYGILYEGFAVLRIWERGLPPGVSVSRSASYLIIGALIMVLFPYFVYRGYRRFTQLVAILVSLRVVILAGILGGFRLPFFFGREPFFLKKMSSDAVYGVALVVAMATLFFLVRAGWDLGRSGRA
ncbi:MAG: hypothetical protein ACE5HC_10540 [Candidatus Binatia bacterium]